MNTNQLEKFLKQKIEHAKIEIIGESVLKRPIYAISFDFAQEKSVIIQGAIHAREHITCNLLCKMISELSVNFEKYKKLKTPNIVFVPLSNPDGASLVTDGLKSVKNLKTRKFLLSLNNKSKDFSLFKANLYRANIYNQPSMLMYLLSSTAFLSCFGISSFRIPSSYFA